MSKTEKKVKKNTKVKEDIEEIIDDEEKVEPKKRKTKLEETQELFLEKDYHGLKVFLSFLVVLLLLGLIGFLYYKKVYSSPLTTFTNSLSNFQKELSKDYKDNKYNKISAILELDLKDNNNDTAKGIEVLNNMQTNMVLVNDKDNTYLEVDTKYDKSHYVNLKLYAKEEDHKTYSYIKLDKYYDKYLKYENKYLQYYPFIKLLHEEDLKDLFTSVINDSMDKNNFTRTYETIDDVKLSKNTLTIKSNDYEKLLTNIVNKIKKDNSLLDKLKKHYPDITNRLDNYLEKVKASPKDITISTYNKRNLKQDLVMIELISNDKKIVLELNDNKKVITITKDNNEKGIVITKNNKASYTIDFTNKDDTKTYKFNLIITLDKTNDIPTLIINDDMSVKELNQETLDSIISEVSNDNLKNVFKLLQKKNS